MGPRMYTSLTKVLVWVLAEMRSAGPLIRFIRHGQMLDDAPWEWGSTGGWCADMPEFFQGMPSGVYDNIWEDLDDSPVSWHITEVACSPHAALMCEREAVRPSVWPQAVAPGLNASLFGCAARRPHRVPERVARRRHQHLLSSQSAE